MHINTDKDIDLKQLEQEAEQGDLYALSKLGEMQLAKKNYSAAANYFCNVVDKTKNTDLLIRLLHHMKVKKIKGKKIAYKVILDYLHKSATQGNLDALKNIGAIYQHGYAGVKQNYSTAADYYRQLAEKDHNDGPLSELLLKLERIPANSISDESEIEHAYSIAADYYRHAADSGDQMAGRELKKLWQHNRTNPYIIYHAAMKLNRSENPDLISAFKNLAETNNPIFYELAEKDNWDKIQSLLGQELTEKTHANIKIYLARKQDQANHFFQEIEAEITTRFPWEKSIFSNNKMPGILREVLNTVDKLKKGEYSYDKAVKYIKEALRPTQYDKPSSNKKTQEFFNALYNKTMTDPRINNTIEQLTSGIAHEKNIKKTIS